jgi:hypothetical protein
LACGKISSGRSGGPRLVPELNGKHIQFNQRFERFDIRAEIAKGKKEKPQVVKSVVKVLIVDCAFIGVYPLLSAAKSKILKAFFERGQGRMHADKTK